MRRVGLAAGSRCGFLVSVSATTGDAFLGCQRLASTRFAVATGCVGIMPAVPWAALSVAFRGASTASNTPAAMTAAEEVSAGGGDERLPCTMLRDEDDGEQQAELNDEEFDELEAASQEVHDLCYGMIAFLRRADPDASRVLFERRVKKGFREPVPEQRRRLIHGHGDKGVRRQNLFQSKKDLQDAAELYFQLGEKLLLLLDKPLMDRLLKSAGKGHRDLRSDGLHRYRRPMERASWRTFPHRWFKHAPFEVQQLRADIPESAVLNTRFYRDHATVRYLFTLMEPQHPYRVQIEKRLFEITQQYDPVERPNAQAAASSPDAATLQP